MNEANYMPSVARVQTVIDTLRLGVSGGGRLNMSEPFVFISSRLQCIDHACGTAYCHAGFYALGAIKRGELPDAAKAIKSGEGRVSYNVGAEQMARDLGVPGCETTPAESMVRWARNHPEIWGNERGNEMLETKMAFFHPTKRPDGAKHPQHIIDHWCEVRDRIAALNQSHEARRAGGVVNDQKPRETMDSVDGTVLFTRNLCGEWDVLVGHGCQVGTIKNLLGLWYCDDLRIDLKKHYSISSDRLGEVKLKVREFLKKHPVQFLIPPSPAKKPTTAELADKVLASVKAIGRDRAADGVLVGDELLVHELDKITSYAELIKEKAV